MHFVVWCIDRPGAADVRQAARPAHRDWLDKYKGTVKLGGPLLGLDNVTSIGSIMIVDAPDEATAKKIYAEEPYAVAGVFQSVTMLPFRWVVDPPK